MRRSYSLWGAVAIASLLLAGCASPPRTNDLPGQAAQWAGRLALRVDSDQTQSFSAGFALKGNAQAGELSLYSPLGSTIAQLVWTPGDARLRSGGKEQIFDSLEALTRQATGTELPVASMFQWLAGKPASAAGWEAELGELSQGRLVARRSAPPPVVVMRLVLE